MVLGTAQSRAGTRFRAFKRNCESYNISLKPMVSEAAGPSRTGVDTAVPSSAAFKTLLRDKSARQPSLLGPGFPAFPDRLGVTRDVNVLQTIDAFLDRIG
jgi:hypothetical protein